MPLNNFLVHIPAIGEDRSTGWAYCSESNFNWRTKTARIVYDLFANKQAAIDNRPPVGTVEVVLLPDTQPAITVNTLITEGTPAVYDEQEELVSEEVAPTYSTSTVYPEIPSLTTLLTNNFQTYADLALVLDTLILTLPQFTGGTIEGA